MACCGSMMSRVCARRELELSHNLLTGVIPESIGALLKLMCVLASVFVVLCSLRVFNAAIVSTYTLYCRCLPIHGFDSNALCVIPHSMLF